MMLSMIYIIFLCVCILEYTTCMDFFHRNNFHFKSNNKGSNTGGDSVSDEYYKLLGIDSQATDIEIKKAYRKQVNDKIYIMKLLTICVIYFNIVNILGYDYAP